MKTANDQNQRNMFRMLREMWRALAEDGWGYSDVEITDEFTELCDIHAQLVALTKPTLH
jgi:hypothetical protein